MQLSQADIPYLQEMGQLIHIAENSAVREDRTQVGTFSHFGSLTEYDLRNGQVPLLGSKHVGFKTVVHELIWMLRGHRSLKYLLDNNVHIWDGWLVPGSEVYQDGKLVDAIVSALYPEAWRGWTHITELTDEEVGQFLMDHDEYVTDIVKVGQRNFVTEVIDQIAVIIKQLQEDPNSRRIILSGWNPGKTHRVKLPACHAFAQFYVEKDNTLTCLLYKRSSDHFLGKPFNLVGYAVLTHLLAHLTGRTSNRLLTMVGDQHLYSNHIEQAKEQCNVGTDIFQRAQQLQQPRITIDPSLTNIDDLTIDHITLEDYIPGPKIEAPVAI